ncbi:spermatogenesis-associated protein 1 [Tachysurus ichikawai]
MDCYVRETTTTATSECLELHVFFVPDEQWNSRLNKVSVEAIDSFISAGFIRVYPDISLKAIRQELGSLLGPERIIDRYCFLKCVGRSLAMVKAKQEKDLKAKFFAPPYSPYPDLYLLPVEENVNSLCSRSLSSDTVLYNTDSQTCYPPRPIFAPGQTKAPTKFPLIKQKPQQYFLAQSLENESSSSSLEEREEDSLGCEDSVWTEAHKMCWNVQEEFVAKEHEMPCINQTSKKTQKNEIKPCYKRNVSRDPGVQVMLEVQDAGLIHSQGRKAKLSPTLKPSRKKPGAELVRVSRADTVVTVLCDSDPSALSQPVHVQKINPELSTNRDELLKEIRLVKEERKKLERTRQELLRKGKELLALNRHYRNQARDKWKRRYFDTKKATAPLEETLKNLRQELESFYNKLFQKLQARDGRNKQRRAGNLSSTKNDLIIQIMTESYEIDNLKKNIDDAKIKLDTEIKLRNQAASELQALKAELLQKKSQCSFTGPTTGSADLG